jgi:SAM-dependent methyltransferase
MKETRSQWECIADQIKDQPQIALGKIASHWYYKTPGRLLQTLSYYKFAAKLIGKEKRVLDVGCKEGLGTWILCKECGSAQGIDTDPEAIESARANFQRPGIEFSVSDILKVTPKAPADAVVAFETPIHAIQAIKTNVTDEGLVIVGAPARDSLPERLEQMMREHFEFVFLFAVNDEVVHTGYFKLAQYLICIGSKKK